MKLTGQTTRFRASGAGAYFTEVNFSHEGEELDMGVANDDRAKSFVEPGSRKARITCRGLVEATSNMNFIDVAIPGRVVDVTDFTGIQQATLDFYKPWQVLRADMSARKRQTNEDSAEFIGTGGAIPADFDPNDYGPPPVSGASGP